MDTTFLAVIFISLTEETVKYRRQVKIVQTVQRETVANLGIAISESVRVFWE